MKRVGKNSEEATRIDAAIASWRQGDVALAEKWFVHVADPRVPLTEAAAESAEDEPVAVPSEVDGLVIVSQTCDVIRECSLRPFVEVSPLCRPKPEMVAEARRGHSTRFAHLPGLADTTLVVDLERTMTVEKAVVATWERTCGCNTDESSRAFAATLARKRARVAFPDEFVAMVKRLQGRLIEKHDKQSAEGRALRSLREIRIQATPGWLAALPSLQFWFIRNDEQTAFDGKGWDHWLQSWLGLIQASDRFGDVDGVVTTLGDMTAGDYVNSDPLDLDHLSSRET